MKKKRIKALNTTDNIVSGNLIKISFFVTKYVCTYQKKTSEERNLVEILRRAKLPLRICKFQNLRNVSTQYELVEFLKIKTHHMVVWYHINLIHCNLHPIQ